jgi:hypothetical protein
MLVSAERDTVSVTLGGYTPVTAGRIRLDPPGAESRTTPVTPRRGSSHSGSLPRARKIPC